MISNLITVSVVTNLSCSAPPSVNPFKIPCAIFPELPQLRNKEQQRGTQEERHCRTSTAYGEIFGATIALSICKLEAWLVSFWSLSATVYSRVTLACIRVTTKRIMLSTRSKIHCGLTWANRTSPNWPKRRKGQTFYEIRKSVVGC